MLPGVTAKSIFNSTTTSNQRIPPQKAQAGPVNILLLTQYYPPEPGSTSNRLESFVQGCQRRGAKVTVLTALPNYPMGRVSSGYRRRIVVREVRNGADIIRVWIWPIQGAGILARGITFGTFALSALLIGLLVAPKSDLIMWDSAPMTLGPVAWLLSKIKGGRLITNVCDLWIASLSALGILREGPLLRIATSMEEFLYRQSAMVSGQTEYIVADVKRRVPTVPVILWRNGADVPGEVRIDKWAMRERWGVPPGRFVIGYAGMFGVSQNLREICNAATLLDPATVTFVMVGDGADKQATVEKSRALGLGNFIWIDPQPHGAMPDIWSAFDCTIISLRKLPLFRGAVPSKLYEAMSYGTPVILAIEGEARKILEASEAGIAVDPEDPKQIAEAIGVLRDNPDRRRRFAENARRAALEYYDRDRLNDRFIDALLGGDPGSGDPG